jgi:hypothetical protein
VLLKSISAATSEYFSGQAAHNSVNSQLKIPIVTLKKETKPDGSTVINKVEEPMEVEEGGDSNFRSITSQRQDNMLAAAANGFDSINYQSHLLRS